MDHSYWEIKHDTATAFLWDSKNISEILFNT